MNTTGTTNKLYPCDQCDKRFGSAAGRRQHVRDKHKTSEPSAGEPDWDGKCETCGASPIVPETGMCGPCSFGEADTAGGNW